VSIVGEIHRFLAGVRPGAPTLLVLHGTGGNEDDLVPLAHEIAPGAALLSPRGPVLEEGMPRFFRRLRPGVFDLEDLARRTAELAGFHSIGGRAIAIRPSRTLRVLERRRSSTRDRGDRGGPELVCGGVAWRGVTSTPVP
jgi:predicted esterase